MSKYAWALWTCLSLAGLAGVASPSCAQDVAVSAESDAAARGAFQEGTAAYDVGRFEDALAAFERAYALSPRPKLLYNIGRSAEGDAQYPRALAAYERYLAILPDAENRQFVESRIAKLRTLVGTTPAAAPPAPAPASQAEPAPLPAPQLPAEAPAPGLAVAPASSSPSPTERPARSRKYAWLWGVAGAVVVGAGIATAVALTRKDGGAKETGEVIMTLRTR